jgi:hypothetical protein
MLAIGIRIFSETPFYPHVHHAGVNQATPTTTRPHQQTRPRQLLRDPFHPVTLLVPMVIEGSKMLWVGIQLDVYTFPCVLRTCGGVPDLAKRREVNVHVLRFGFESDVDMVNALITMYVLSARLVNVETYLQNFGHGIYSLSNLNDILSQY